MQKYFETFEKGKSARPRRKLCIETQIKTAKKLIDLSFICQTLDNNIFGLNFDVWQTLKNLKFERLHFITFKIKQVANKK